MLGRAIFGRPWLFTETTPSLPRRLQIAAEHTALFEELLGDVKSFALMKKHFKAYVEGFPGARELRAALMRASCAVQVGEILRQFVRG
jgi:tRNA-dihydrouridine synthase